MFAALLLALLGCSDRTGTVSTSVPSATRPTVLVRRIQAADMATAIHMAISGRTLTTNRDLRSIQDLLIRLYAPGGFAPLWVDNVGRPNHDAHDAIALLTGAAADSVAATPAQPADIAAFEIDLSANTLRYLRELHQGRVDPRSIGFRMTVPPDEHDFASLLRSALSEHRVPQLASDLTPPLALYRALRDSLARYRRLAADPTLQAPPPAVTTIRPSQAYAGLDTLSRWLVARPRSRRSARTGDAVGPARAARAARTTNRARARAAAVASGSR